MNCRFLQQRQGMDGKKTQVKRIQLVKCDGLDLTAASFYCIKMDRFHPSRRGQWMGCWTIENLRTCPLIRT